jgi:LPXTG-motif cell wall-anchored protein
VQVKEQTSRIYDPVVPASGNTGLWSGLLLVLGIFLAACVLAGSASAYSNPESIAAAGKVYVSSVSIDPEVFFTGETGTATFYVTNGNANQSISVNHATFGDKDIRLKSGTYDTSANIGPLQTRTFVFSVATDAVEGTYYPTFSLSLRDASENLYYVTPVKVENTPITVSVTDQPDTFTRDQKSTITVQIANPRENDVKNVVLEVSGDGITATPAKIYVGDLISGASLNKTVAVTPGKETDLKVTVNYDNGDNAHTTSVTLPITFGTDKKQADPVISNVKVTTEGSVYHVTGDVTNAGLQTANAVTVSSASPAVPVDPYKDYVVGVLKPDDFGSFEVSFTSGSTTVPLQMSWKDADGNVKTSQKTISLAAATSTDKNTGQPSMLPIIGVILIIALASGGYLYLKRKKNQ